MKNKKTFSVSVLVGLLLLVGIWWIRSPRNKAPLLVSVTALPTTVLSKSECMIMVAASDPEGDSLCYTYAARSGVIVGAGKSVRWCAPATDSVVTMVIYAHVTDPSAKADSGSVAVQVVPVGWQGLMRTFLQDTVVASAGTVPLCFTDMILAGYTSRQSYSATGGTYDTLAENRIRWVAPRVTHDTSFVLTLTVKNEYDNRIVKTIMVVVQAATPKSILSHTSPEKMISLAESSAVLLADSLRAAKNARLVEEAARSVQHDTSFAQTSTQDTSRTRTAEHVVADSLRIAGKQITGTVRTMAGRTLPGVRVSLAMQETFSNDDGVYVFSAVQEGDTLKALFTAQGYTAEKLEMIVPHAQVYTFDVVLRLEALAPPSGLQTHTVPDTAYLSWDKSSARNMAGYAVYRSENEYTGYDKVHDKLLALHSYTDVAVEDSVKYYYRIATVNRDNVEGELSDFVTAVVPIKKFAVKSMYASPFPNPTGIVFDGYTIWSCDNKVGKIFKHDWNLKVVKTVKSPDDLPTGMAWDGRYLWTCDFKQKYIYKHGKSMKVVAKFKGPGYNLTDLTWDGQNLWACNGQGKIFKLDAQCKVLRTYRSPYSLSTGIAWQDGFLWTSSIHTHKIYRLKVTGHELVIDDVYESPFLLSDGFAFDGKHFWACGKVTEKMYKFSFK